MSRNIDTMPETVAHMRAGQTRHPVTLPFRILSSALRVFEADDVANISEEKIIAGQKPFPRNLVTDLFFGKCHPEVRMQDVAMTDLVTLRIYSPKGFSRPIPCVLYMHGGGWVSGDVGMTDWWCSRFARMADVVVVSVGYRLAPIHRFPSGLEDCYDALCWTRARHQDLGIDPNRIGVAGDSAGANLAAALCLYSLAEAGPPIDRQILIYPSLDFEFHSPSMREEANAPLLTAGAVRAYVGHYLGEAEFETLRTDPFASPLHAQTLRSMPPALIQMAEHDPLRDDGWRYAEQLRQDGVEATVTEYPGMPHGFALFRGLSRMTTDALREAAEFQRMDVPRKLRVVSR